MTTSPRKFGRYRVIEPLGKGSMARVYLAEDLTLGRRVAVKVISASPDLREDERARVLARFVREYQVTAGLEHANVVTVFDVGEQDGEPFIAMEYVRGPSLEDVLAEEAPMTAGQIFDLFAPIADALDQAHRHGVVHRDLKPTNVLLTDAETPKVADFGLAKVAATTILTRASSIVGTPAYMSPEQVTGHEISGTADQFALAAILYRALTGERPFTGKTATTIMYKIVNEDPVPPHHINRLLPEAASRALLRGLAKDAGDRFATCRDLVQALIHAMHEPPAAGAARPDAGSGAGKRRAGRRASGRRTAAGSGAAETSASTSVATRAAGSRSPGREAGGPAGGTAAGPGTEERGWLGALGAWIRRRLTRGEEGNPPEDRPVDPSARTALTGSGDDEVDVAAETVRMRRPADDD